MQTLHPQVWLKVRDIAIRYIEDNVMLSASCTKLVLDTDKNDKQVMAFFFFNQPHKTIVYFINRIPYALSGLRDNVTDCIPKVGQIWDW